MELIVISGPMFAGKTTELLRILRKYEIAKRKVLLIKPTRDTRHKKVTTHDGISSGCITTSTLGEVPEDLIFSNNVVGIDEGQFFDDLFDFIVSHLDKHIIFVVAGLTETFISSVLFDQMSKVFAIANKCIRLTAVCNECGGEAVYSYNKTYGRTIPDNTVQIGGKNDYLALCRKCYFSK